MLSVTFPKSTSVNYWRDIVVDGIVWGHVVKWGRGVHGYYCSIEDCSYTTIFNSDARELRIWSDKHAVRNAPRGASVLPFFARLEQAVRDAIANDRLQSPEVVNARLHRQRRAIAEGEDKLKREALRKIDDVIDPVRGPLTITAAHDLRGRIIELLAWANEHLMGDDIERLKGASE